MSENSIRLLALIVVLAVYMSFSNSYASDSVGDSMIFVPAGEFIMGATSKVENPSSDELPAHKVYVKAFYVDKYETTNAEYKRFIDAVRYKVPDHWKNGLYPKGKDNYPVYNVTWEDAMNYCKWKGKRLPSEAEWEKAARGTDGGIYPWGNKFDHSKANTMERGDGKSLSPVGSFESGKSPYGVYDMAGNVWEWVQDYYEPYQQQVETNEFYGKKFRVIRGGSAHFNAYSARTTNRNIVFPYYRYFLVGFRCALSSEE